jgi:hypothetical protein
MEAVAVWDAVQAAECVTAAVAAWEAVQDAACVTAAVEVWEEVPVVEWEVVAGRVEGRGNKIFPENIKQNTDTAGPE